MPTWAPLTARRIKPGAYDDWRAAWLTDEDDIPSGLEIFILRKVGDPDEVIAFGLWDAAKEELESMRPPPEDEDARQARMAPYVDSVFADGFYEVVERIQT